MYGDRFSIEIELLTRQRAKVLDKQLKESKSKQEKTKDNKLGQVQQSPSFSRSAQCLWTRLSLILLKKTWASSMRKMVGLTKTSKNPALARSAMWRSWVQFGKTMAG